MESNKEIKLIMMDDGLLESVIDQIFSESDIINYIFKNKINVSYIGRALDKYHTMSLNIKDDEELTESEIDKLIKSFKFAYSDNNVRYNISILTILNLFGINKLDNEIFDTFTSFRNIVGDYIPYSKDNILYQLIYMLYLRFIDPLTGIHKTTELFKLLKSIIPTEPGLNLNKRFNSNIGNGYLMDFIFRFQFEDPNQESPDIKEFVEELYSYIILNDITNFQHIQVLQKIDVNNNYTVKILDRYIKCLDEYGAFPLLSDVDIDDIINEAINNVEMFSDTILNGFKVYFSEIYNNN